MNFKEHFSPAPCPRVCPVGGCEVRTGPKDADGASAVLRVPRASTPSRQVGRNCHPPHTLPPLPAGATRHTSCGCVEGQHGGTHAFSRDRGAGRPAEGEAAEAQRGPGSGGAGAGTLSPEGRGGVGAGPRGEQTGGSSPNTKQPEAERGCGSRLGEPAPGRPLEKRENRVPQSRAAGLLPSCGRGPAPRCPAAATAPFRRRRPLQAPRPTRGPGPRPARRPRGPPPAPAPPPPRSPPGAARSSGRVEAPRQAAALGGPRCPATLPVPPKN